MSTFIHVSAGFGSPVGPFPTEKFAVRGTDLGFLFEGGKQLAPDGRSSLWVGGVFGDTFRTDSPTSGGDNPDWRSPVMGRTSNTDFLTRGIAWDNFAGSANTGGRAKEIFPYRHIGKNGTVNGSNFDCFTIIPNDIIQLPNGQYMGMGFRVKDWDTSATQQMCHTLSNAWFWSIDPHADTWEPCRHTNNLGRLYEWANSGRNHFFQNSTFLMGRDENVYVFGSPEGRKTGPDSGIYLRRAHWTRLTDDSAWEYWGWTGNRWEWGNHVQPTPILKPVTPNGVIGELNAQRIAGKIVLTYTDSVLGSVALTADRPDEPWSSPTILTTRLELPSQYAPSVHPWTKDLNNAYFHISTWDQTPAIGPIPSVTVRYATLGHRASLVSGINLPSVGLSSRLMGLDTEAMTDGEREDTITKIFAASAEVNPYTVEA